MKKFVFLYLCLTVLAVSLSSISAQEITNHFIKTSKTILVTFSVDMELWSLAGLFNPTTDTVFIGGNFNAWEKTKMTVSQSNPDIYSTTISVTDSVQDTIRFNFCYSPDIWEVMGVREYVITQANYDSGVAVLDAIGFDSEPLSPPSRVEFRCNMSVQMKKGDFARGEKVFVRGDFNGWSGNDFELKDVDGDSIYSRIFPNFKRDQSLVFKFTNNHGGNDNWEDIGNRTLTVSLLGLNTYTAYWEDGMVFLPTKTIQVTFSVNMELERLAGLFNPQADSVSVRGSFNDWDQTKMTAIPDSTDIYRVVVPVIATVDEKISFKFFHSPGTWEINNLTDNTHNERYFIVTKDIFDTGSLSLDILEFNGGLPDPYYPGAFITFTCNTNGASIINAPAGTEFKTIHMAGGNVPLQWPSSGWPDQDISNVIQLFDDGTHHDAVAGDKIFTIDIIFPSYSSLNKVYKYSANWGLSTNGGKNDNEAPIGGDKTLKLHRKTAQATILDTFGIVHTTVLPDPTKVEKLDETPSKFALEQNFPNPFNPETRISWQLAVSSFVTLKVFDVLGNEVATLVNEEQSAGTYQVSFNTLLTTNYQQLTSGIYFYQLRAGDFVQTKKMILLR